jgi:hypothetical protein
MDKFPAELAVDGVHGPLKQTICIGEHLQKWDNHIPRPKAISNPFLLQTTPNKQSFILAAEFTEPLGKMDLCLHFCLLLVEHF